MLAQYASRKKISNALIGATFLMGVGYATASHAGSVGTNDNIVLFDRSASTSNVTPFLGSTFTNMDSQLRRGGIDGQYGLQTFVQAYYGSNSVVNSPYVFPNGRLFGDGAAFKAAADSVINQSGSVDGYDAIEYAMKKAGYLDQMRSGASRYMFLVTDTYREVILTSMTRSKALSLLKANDVRLVSFVDVTLTGADGSRLAVVYKNSKGELVGVKADGSKAVVAAGDIKDRFASNNLQGSQYDIKTLYAQLALDSGGMVADLNLISSGSLSQDALAAAFMAGIGQTLVLPRMGEITSNTIQKNTQQVERAQISALQKSISARVGQIVSAVAAKRQSVASAGPAGIAGGESSDRRYGLWIDTSYSFLRNKSELSEMHGTAKNALLGLDYFITPQIMAGVALGAEWSNLSLDYVSGSRNSNGGSISPYVAYLINNYLTVDAQFTYARTNTDLRQEILGIQNYGSFDTNRFSGALNLTGVYALPEWELRGRLGYVIAHSDSLSFSDNLGNKIRSSESDLQQARVGSEVAYVAFKQAQPFLVGTFEYDIHNDTSHNRTGGVVGGGARVNMDDMFQGANMEMLMTKEVGRDDERNFTVGVNVRVAF